MSNFVVIVKRDTSVCFYDCTNYYFETETDDEDYVDEVTGEPFLILYMNGQVNLILWDFLFR